MKGREGMNVEFEIKRRLSDTNEKVTLSGVPETMLQTVFARAKEIWGRGAIRDKKAEEIINGLDDDFSLADKDAAMHSGVIARTIVLDRLVGEYLAKNPGAVVVNIACGLDKLPAVRNISNKIIVLEKD